MQMQEPTRAGSELRDRNLPDAVQPASPDEDGVWSPLHPAARALFAMGGGLSGATTGALACIPLGFLFRRVLDMDLGVLWFALPPLLGATLGWWLGLRRWRHTWWRFDANGLALRRGRLWQRETRVPIARVQHLDLKRGPLERRRGLATLVLHTAGTQASTVSIAGLALGDAEALREGLLRVAPAHAGVAADAL